MPRPKTDDFWRESAMTKFAQKEGVSVAQVHRELKADAEEMEKSDDLESRAMASTVPSERTIGRIKAEEWGRLEEADRAQYREFYWPESMEGGDLPWEASESALELLFFLDQLGFRPRPPLRFVTWFWRVSTAAPNMLMKLRVLAAMWLAVKEVGYKPGPSRLDTNRGLEMYLAYFGEPSERRRDLYYEALNRNDAPIAGAPGRLSLGGVGTMFQLRYALLTGITPNFAPGKERELANE